MPPIERRPVGDPTPPRRSNDLLIQAGLAGGVCTLATAAAIVPADPIISGDGLIGLYAAALTYVFGVGNGVRLARKSEGEG